MYSEVDACEAIISIGILVLNDDQACRNNVAEVLRHCKYHQVLHTGTVYDALHAIWEKKDRIALVITNAQILKFEGLAIIQHIEQKLKLNVLTITNDHSMEPKGELFSFSAYELNGLSIKGFYNLLENARRMEAGKMAEYLSERESISNAAVETKKASSSIYDGDDLNQEGKAAELYRKMSEDSRYDHDKSKKQRMNWTKEMHEKFLNAVEKLGGPREAVPKKIVEVMGVPWLDRAGWLFRMVLVIQKYRNSLKNTTNEGACLGVVASPMALRLASSRAYLPAFKESSKDVPFGTISGTGRKFYGSHLCDDQSEVIKKLKNRSLCRDNGSSSTEFVGFRFQGNNIDYGPIKKITTSYVQHHPISKQNLVGSGGSMPQKSCLLRDSNSSIQEQNLAQKTLSSTTREEPHQIHVQHSYDTAATANASTTSFMFPPPTHHHHQDLVLPPQEARGSDFSEQSTASFVDDILQQQQQQHGFPPPPMPQMFHDLEEIFEQSGKDEDYLMSGIGNAYDQFDFIPELDDALFSEDD